MRTQLSTMVTSVESRAFASYLNDSKLDESDGASIYEGTKGWDVADTKCIVECIIMTNKEQDKVRHFG